jgi:hypothetical protein
MVICSILKHYHHFFIDYSIKEAVENTDFYYKQTKSLYICLRLIFAGIKIKHSQPEKSSDCI